jgi:cell division septum initiation protein DivIVA
VVPKLLSKETLVAALLELVDMSANGRINELSVLFNAVKRDGTVEDFYFQAIVNGWAEAHGCVLIDQRRLSSYRLKVRDQLKNIEKQKGFSALKAMWNGDLNTLREQLFDEAEALTSECNALESRVAQLRTETFALEAKQITIVDDVATKCDQRIEAAHKQAVEIRSEAQAHAKKLIDDASEKAKEMLGESAAEVHKQNQAQNELTVSQQNIVQQWQADAQALIQERERSSIASLVRLKEGLETDILALTLRRSKLMVERSDDAGSSAMVPVDSRSLAADIAVDLSLGFSEFLNSPDAKERWLTTVAASVRDFSAVELREGVGARRRLLSHVIQAVKNLNDIRHGEVLVDYLRRCQWYPSFDSEKGITLGQIFFKGFGKSATALDRLNELIVLRLKQAKIKDRFVLVESSGQNASASSLIPAFFKIVFSAPTAPVARVSHPTLGTIHAVAYPAMHSLKFWRFRDEIGSRGKLLSAELSYTQLTFYFDPSGVRDQDFEELIGEPLAYAFSSGKIDW